MAISLLDRMFSYLPCYVINRDPLIIISYWHDFITARKAFLAGLAAYRNVHILVQIGWQRETPERARELVDALAALEPERPGWRFTFLGNSPRETENLRAAGLKAVFCHQNAFVDERFYPVVPKAKKLYDAIYIARITPFKRQELAQKIKTLRFIGWTSPDETDYFHKIMTAIPQAEWTCNVASRQIYREINAARTGLCLSAEEGAMFVSAEYLLCGIPVVTTRSLGGRDALFPDGTFCYVDHTPEAVAAGVEQMFSQAPAPAEIRRAYLARMQEHRRVFVDLVQGIIDSTGGRADFRKCWKKIFIHKLGLRRRLPVWTKIKRGIRRK
ncbi:MAG: hypothetical protein PHH77_03010 [Victivallaceae bacterium]|nr:hypothetical protein [Victivallaceae bacterium]